MFSVYRSVWEWKFLLTSKFIDSFNLKWKMKIAEIYYHYYYAIIVLLKYAMLGFM